MIEQINDSKVFIEKQGIIDPEIGIVLGTGLGKLISYINIKTEIPYSKIPHFVSSTLEFHEGKLIYGTLKGKKILAMQGRFHYYEGYDMKQITFPIRVFKSLGIKKLIISNAAGSMNPELKKAELMLLEDHINLLPENPLRGINYKELGPRFSDMSEPYSKELNKKIKEVAIEENIKIHEGVYVAVQGPNLETRSEYRYLKSIGADAVGMSTVPEVIVANHMKIECAGISVITDECNPDNLKPVDLPDIFKCAAMGEKKLISIILKLFEKI